MESVLTVSAISLSFCFLTFIAYSRSGRSSLRSIQGDNAESFWFGHFKRLFWEEAGALDLEWVSKYGRVARYKAPFGEDRLLIADAKAMQYIFHKSGYLFRKAKDRLEVTRLTAGRGLAYADGEVHKKQRRIMQPGFGMPEARSFLPIFSACVAKMSGNWMDLLEKSAEDIVVIDACYYLKRSTLDAIGEAAFDYKFNALDDPQSPLGTAWSSFIFKFFGFPSATELFIRGLLGVMPPWIRAWLIDHTSSPRFIWARHTAQVTDSVARELVREKMAASLSGTGKRDIMSVLICANAGQNPQGKLEDWELLEQMRTIIFTGFDTTGNTILWALYELALNPDVQTKLRQEIWSHKDKIATRGETGWTAQEFESMPYLVAFAKEVLRLYPALFQIERQASEDAVLPLSTPITSTKGHSLESVLIPKGTKILVSVFAYNRDKSIWGADANSCNPDRWANLEKAQTPIGVYGNLFSFSGGHRSCIAWRIAVIELHTYIAELVSRFVFGLTPAAKRIRREPCVIMIPTVEGDRKGGSQLPLTITLASRNG